jgi:membrane protease YdiL (CAAX protease family)
MIQSIQSRVLSVTLYMLRGPTGILLGFASITALLTIMRLADVLHFGNIVFHGAEAGKWAVVYALVFILVALKEEFFNRGYLLFTLTTGIGPEGSVACSVVLLVVWFIGALCLRQVKCPSMA